MTGRRNAPERIRHALTGVAGGCTVRDLTRATALHENAVRRALARLVTQGEIAVERRPATARGRPPLRYRLVAAAEQPFKALLPILLDLVDRSGGSGGAAYAAGYAHGSSAPRSPQGTREALVSSLVSFGFAPAEQRAEGTQGTTLDLTRCPFRDAVTGSANGRQICSLHHGLLAGIAGANGGAVDEFVVNDPRVLPCRVRFRELAVAGSAAR